MADNLTTMLVRLGLTPLMWFLRLLIILTGKYLANLITLFFYLEHVSDNINKFKIPPKNRKSKANSKEKALKLLNRKIKFHKCLEMIVQYHRKKHLKIRNKIKFRPALPTIEEVDETDQTPCNSPYLPPFNQPSITIPSPAPTTNNSTLSTPRSIEPINLGQNFSKYSFLIPDFIVPSDSTPFNFNNNFAAQFNHYIQQKNSRKPFRYIKRKFKSLRKKLLKKIILEIYFTCSNRKIESVDGDAIYPCTIIMSDLSLLSFIPFDPTCCIRW
ncbi:hypothetical protein TNIN_495901 [Trichonephila inaurata madagascariensis]|uniref:Uncharacterized protein n=1 Tax=Trichonephila inaurata madagascariensis TaxID=2747483 RepID=A0A8X6YJU0_9ARAC|nr:hypothetical protein TNIN_495901 [Trichonephila inaurata madagascariensis]